jgi:pyruvoyl-dependent arginine decarboxylase (PvlArgDC)
MEALKPAEDSYQSGDTFFQEEHEQWTALGKELLLEGYTYEEVEELRKIHAGRCAEACAKESAVSRELRMGESIFRTLYADEDSVGFEQEKDQEKTIQKEQKDEPRR